MNQLFINMAQEVSKDSALMASLIQQRAKGEGITWEQLAARLDVSLTQLAKLAFCERPQFESPVAYGQMAEYVGMPQGKVAQFIQQGLPAKSKPKRQRQWVLPLKEVGSMFRHRSLAFGLAAIVVLALSAFVFAKPVDMGATLVVSSGEAVVIQNGSILLVLPNDTETAVAAGNLISVGAGDVIKLPASTTAQLRLYDGSTVDLFEHTTLKVSELVTDESRFQVRLTMLSGRTVNRVVRALGVGDRYEVHTPSSTASVRGTVFTVDVLSDRSSHYSCAEGVVHISMNGQGVDIRAGEEITADLDQPLPGGDRPPVDPPVGPPEQVPGHTPIGVPGNGNPPEGGGLPPGKANVPVEVPGDENEPTPDEEPVYPPDDNEPPAPSDDPPAPEDEGDKPPAPGDQGDDPPMTVPGNTPDELPPQSQGNPPGGGGTPPGQGDDLPPGQQKKDK